MTNEERQRVQRLAREAAADYSYGDNTTNPGRILEVRRARNAAHYPNYQEAIA